MSLSEKLKKVTVPSEIVTVSGIRFRCIGKSLLDGAEITAKAAKKKVKKPGYLDACWLAECVEDVDDGSKMTAEEWISQPRKITGPLIAVISKLNGLDDEDLERDPKESDSTEIGS